MTISLYISVKDVEETIVEEFITSLKKFLAEGFAGKDITIQINYY